MRHRLALVCRAQRGLTTVEYAAAGGLVTAAIIVGFIALGGNVLAVLTALHAALVSSGG